MKSITSTIILLTAGLIYSGGLTAQGNRSIEKYLESLPEDLELVEKSPQKYVMTAEYFNKDMYGNSINSTKITGEYTRGYKDGHAIWNNVYLSQSTNQSGTYSGRAKLEIQTEELKSRGSECYWGKTWVSLENKQIEYAEMYSNTIQEMEIMGLNDPMRVSTRRVLKVERMN